MAVICAIGVVSVRLFTRESTAEETMPMDWLGVLPLTVSIGSLLIAFNEAGKLADANWFDGRLVCLYLVASVSQCS